MTRLKIHTAPLYTRRGICMALLDAYGDEARKLFYQYLAEQGLDRWYPVQQLIQHRCNHLQYHQDCKQPGHWDLSTAQGRARLTLWGAFLHWLEVNHADKVEVVS